MPEPRASADPYELEPFALQMRAHAYSLLSAGDCVRDGVSDRLEVGRGGADEVVDGTDALWVGGQLTETSDGHARLDATHVERTVHGTYDVTCMKHDTTMGGAMIERHLNGSLLLAGMSDDLVGGGGVRLTGPLDMWMAAGLMGMEEKIGTAIADGVLIEAYGKMFEREFGASQHVAGVALMTGSVRVTTASGFWPLNKISNGVRMLAPGGGGGGGGDASPAPPGAPPGAAPAILCAGTGSAGAVVRGAANIEDVTDLSRLDALARAAGVEDASDLVRVPETAEDAAKSLQRLDEIPQRTERVAELENLAGPKPTIDPRTMTQAELEEWQKANDADDWLDMLNNAAPPATAVDDDGVTTVTFTADDLEELRKKWFAKGAENAADLDARAADARKAAGIDDFDFDEAAKALEAARKEDRVATRLGASRLLGEAQQDLQRATEDFMTALTRGASPEEAERLNALATPALRRQALVEEIAKAKEGGDIARAAELEWLLIGFDSSAKRIIDSANDAAGAARALADPPLPPGVAKDRVRDALQAKMDALLASNPSTPEEMQQLADQVAMYQEAIRLVEEGKDPRRFLQDQADYVRYQHLLEGDDGTSGQYANRAVIYSQLAAEVIAAFEEAAAQGMRLDDLKSLEDAVALRLAETAESAERPLRLSQRVPPDDLEEARRLTIVDDARDPAQRAASAPPLDYARIEDVTKTQPDAVIGRVDDYQSLQDLRPVLTETPPEDHIYHVLEGPAPRPDDQIYDVLGGPGRFNPDPDLADKWAWEASRPVASAAEPLDPNLDRVRAVEALRRDQTKVVSDFAKNLPDTPEARRHAAALVREKQRVYTLVLDAIRRGDDPMVLLDDEIALARYIESLNDARYAQEFGDTARLAGRADALEEVRAQVLRRLLDYGYTPPWGLAGTDPEVFPPPPPPEPPGPPREPPPGYADPDEWMRPAAESLDGIAVEASVSRRASGSADTFLTEGHPLGDAFESLYEATARADEGFESLYEATSKADEGFESLYEATTIYYVIESPPPVDDAADKTDDAADAVDSIYDLARPPLTAPDGEYENFDAIARAADDARIYDLPPDAFFTVEEMAQLPSKADLRRLHAKKEVGEAAIVWAARKRSLFHKGLSAVKERWYDLRSLPSVLFDVHLANEGTFKAVLAANREGRRTGMGFVKTPFGKMRVIDAIDMARHADIVFDNIAAINKARAFEDAGDTLDSALDAFGPSLP